jgi:hypothetical protein
VRSRAARLAFVVVALIVAPIVGYNIAVAEADDLDWRVVLLILFGLPVVVAVGAALALRRTGRGAALGATGAVGATAVLIALVVYLTLEMH